MTMMSICRYGVTSILVLCVALVFLFGLSSTQAQQATATPIYPTSTRPPATRTPFATSTSIPPTPTQKPCLTPSAWIEGVVFLVDGMYIMVRNETGDDPIYLTGVTIDGELEEVMIQVYTGGALVWPDDVIETTPFTANHTSPFWQAGTIQANSYGHVAFGYPINYPTSAVHGTLTFSCDIYGTNSLIVPFNFQYQTHGTSIYDPEAQG
jgi:hypothetical protein